MRTRIVLWGVWAGWTVLLFLWPRWWMTGATGFLFFFCLLVGRYRLPSRAEFGFYIAAWLLVATLVLNWQFGVLGKAVRGEWPPRM